MAKSIKLKNNIYLDSTGIIFNRHNLETKLQEKSINTSTSQTQQKWIKLCNIKIDTHIQGEFIYMKVFLGYGNNGHPNQNAYIDLILQTAWNGSINGRCGVIAELHPFLTPFTTSNTKIKVIFKEVLNYDVWFKATEQYYCKPNYIVFGSQRVKVTQEFILSDDEPIYGSACELTYLSV